MEKRRKQLNDDVSNQGNTKDDEEKTRRLDRKLDEEVRFMMAEASGADSMCGDPDLRGGGLSGVGKTKMKTTNFVFEPMKNWMNSKDRVETVEGWTCRLYSASALLEAVSVLKGSPFAALRNHPGMTFEEYVKFEVGDKDTVLRLLSDTPENSPGGDALDLNDPSTSPRAVAAAAAAAAAASREKEDAKKEKPRKVAARCWMAEGFPFSLKELLPLLHIIGRVNKTIMKVSKFIERYGTMDLFPVKLQVPIAMTVYLLVTFRDFQRRGDEPSKTNAGWGWFGGGSSGGGSFDTLIRPDDVPEGFFDIPSDYKEREVEDVLKEWSEEVEAKNGMEGNSELMDRELDDQSFAFL
ncbi:hypothetical protein PPROV_001069200 [Pycnococcus provasolii]|uniref:Ankyrin repeat domain-containing protein n=1 Tax=Pycnococcus provasolii TaxID=41880 RepID=A0A830HZD6_9CHLO|nr:hypothetical protein PPROV_001069200 [Pycnococcus provasolii]